MSSGFSKTKISCRHKFTIYRTRLNYSCIVPLNVITLSVERLSTNVCCWLMVRVGQFFLRLLQDGGRLLVLRQYSNWNSYMEKFQEKNRSLKKTEWKESMTSPKPGISNTGVTMYCHYTSHSIRCQHTHFIACLSKVLILSLSTKQT